MPHGNAQTHGDAHAAPDSPLRGQPWDGADPEALHHERLRRQRRSRAWTASVALAGIALAALGTPSDQDMAWGGLHVPSSCIFRKLTQTGCPFCGMTRATAFAIHGDFAKSWQMNQVGVLVAAVMFLAVVYCGLGAIWPRAVPVAPEVEAKWLNRIVLGLIGLMVVRWAVVLIFVR